jgi:cytochrome bd-type quinol oxidase subunit 2
VDRIFGDIDFARGILYLAEVANDATEHMRKDFAAMWDGAHLFLLLAGSMRLVGGPFLGL